NPYESSVGSPEENETQEKSPSDEDIKVGEKVQKQMGQRGWTKESIQNTVNNPARKVSTKDQRHLPGGGQMDDPATAYINADGSYVIRNDRTGDVVQISNRKGRW